MQWQPAARYLREAGEHVARGRQHIANQARMAQQLQRHGHNSAWKGGKPAFCRHSGRSGRNTL